MSFKYKVKLMWQIPYFKILRYNFQVFNFYGFCDREDYIILPVQYGFSNIEWFCLLSA